MNICFYTHRKPNPNIGGIERVTYNLSKYFEKLGYKIYNLTSFGDDKDSVIPQDVSDAEKSKFVNEFLSKNEIDVLIDQYGSLPILEHPHIPQNVKVINCYHITPQGKHSIRGLTEPFSFTEFSYGLFNIACLLNTPRRRYFFRKNLRRKVYGGVDKMVYLSPNYIPYVQRLSKGNPEVFTAIPNAAEDILTSITQQDIKKKNKTLIWCGRIVHSHKNVLFLPRLWKKLQNMHPDWEMVIVGDGIDRNMLERRIKKYKLERIKITGFTDPYPYYKTASISVLPSFYEGFPMVLIEAMAYGCVPVVFDNTGSYHDIIDSGKNGLIVKDMDENAFIEACHRLMSDSSYLQSISEEAKSCVHKFSMDKVAMQWENLFHELMHKDN